MSMINIDELHRINEQRNKNKLEIYEKILKKCHERIKFVSKTPKNNQFCFFIVPSFVYGVPIYNINECIVYVIKLLIKNGFTVNYTHPNLIFISWFNKNNSIEYKKKEKKKEEFQYKKIDNIKTNNNFLYDKNVLNFLK